MGEDLEDWIADDKYAFALETLANEVFLASFGVRKENAAGVVDESAIRLFRNAVVVAAVPGLKVIHGNPTTCRGDRRKAGVRVSQNQNSVWSDALKKFVGGLDDSAELLRETSGTYSEVNIWLTDCQFGKEDVAELRRVVLAGVNQQVIGEFVKQRYGARQSDDLWARPKDRHDLSQVGRLPMT